MMTPIGLEYRNGMYDDIGKLTGEEVNKIIKKKFTKIQLFFIFFRVKIWKSQVNVKNA